MLVVKVHQDRPHGVLGIQAEWAPRLSEGTLFPTSTYTDPVRGAGAAPVAFCRIPFEPRQSLAVVTDRRGKCDDPAAASGLLHTLRATSLDAPMLAPADPCCPSEARKATGCALPFN